TNTRGSGQGISQLFSFQSSLGISTNNPYGPGKGDLLVCLKRPTFQVYRATRDRDFRYIVPKEGQTPAFEIFPMQDLLNPQPGTPEASLTAGENSFLRALNPLLSDPHAMLNQPRYYMIHDLSFDGASLNGAQMMLSVT